MSEEWEDITDKVVDVEQEGIQSIELDCPPGPIRPGDLIDKVLEGTGLVAEGHLRGTFFGNWRYEWEMSREEWEARIQPIAAPRIRALYEQGLIRWGSW